MAPSIITLNTDGTLFTEVGEVHLTGKERALLIAVAGRKGGILAKDAALTELYSGMDEPEGKIIDVFICKIRTKLKAIGAPDAIETVWAQGYRWSKSVELLVPNGGFVYMETTPKLIQRLEDLALASNCKVSILLQRIVTENLDDYEVEVWA